MIYKYKVQGIHFVLSTKKILWPWNRWIVFLIILLYLCISLYFWILILLVLWMQMFLLFVLFLRNDLSVMDRWILSRLSHMVSVANKNFEAYDLHLITAGFITFWQNHLCDVYLVRINPLSKIILASLNFSNHIFLKVVEIFYSHWYITGTIWCKWVITVMILPLTHFIPSYCFKISGSRMHSKPECENFHFMIVNSIDSLQESIKPSLKRGSEESRAAIICTLWTCVEVGLRVLSPFMPFLTEELYQRLPSTMGKKESIMQCDYPLHSEVNAFQSEQIIVRASVTTRGLAYWICLDVKECPYIYYWLLIVV